MCFHRLAKTVPFLAVLQLESLRAMSAFLKGGLLPSPLAEERDIDVDPDFRLFNNMISRFKEARDEAGNQADEEPDANVLMFDKTLTPLQRRKAHMMCEYNNCYHQSIGTGLRRQVKCVLRNDDKVQMQNPLDFPDEGVSVMEVTTDIEGKSVDKPAYFSEDEDTNFAWNWAACNEMEMPRRLLQLRETVTDDAGPVMFYIMDILLLLLVRSRAGWRACRP